MEDGGYLVWKSKCASPNTRRAFPRLLGFHSESFYILPSVRAALENGDRGQHSWGLRLLLLLMRAPDIWLRKKNGRYRDARSGPSLCPRGTAGQLWGRSPSASPPATACKQKRGSFTQTGGWQTKRIHVDTLTSHGKKSQYHWHQTRWWQLKEKENPETKVFIRVSAGHCCVPHPERLCSTWKRCIWTSPVLPCPICATERQHPRFNELCPPRVERGRPSSHTHSWRLKGTPSTSKRSISKSTPIVAL